MKPEYREHVTDTLQRYHVQPDAIDLVIKWTVFSVLDLSSPRGGGKWWGPHNIDPPIWWTRDKDALNKIQLNGTNAPACIHECAHCYWQNFRHQDTLRKGLILAMMDASDEPVWAAGNKIIDLCYTFVHGDGWQFPGMYDPDTQKWNDHEIFAGLASGCMGDLDLMPPYLREYYDPYFAGLRVDTEKIYIPVVLS